MTEFVPMGHDSGSTDLLNIGKNVRLLDGSQLSPCTVLWNLKKQKIEIMLVE